MRDAISCCVFIAVLTCGLVACKDKATDSGQLPLMQAKDEALMERAMARARSTTQTFIAALTNPQPEHHSFAVKKGFAVKDGGTEYIWISELTWDGQTFEGVVGNIPQKDVAVKLGSRVRVTPQELADWMYLDGMMLMGNYTLRVLYHESSPEEKAEMDKGIPFTVPPIDF